MMTQWIRKRLLIKAISLMMLCVFGIVTVMPTATVFAAEVETPVTEGEQPPATPPTTPVAETPPEPEATPEPEETEDVVQPAEGEFMESEENSTEEPVTFTTKAVPTPTADGKTSTPVISVNSTVSIYDTQIIYAWLDDQSAETDRSTMTVENLNSKITIDGYSLASPVEITLKKDTPLELKLNLDRTDVSGLSNGQSLGTIKITTTDSKSVSINVKYSEEEKPLTGVKLPLKELRMAVGETKMILPSQLTPSNATDVSLGWKSLHPDIATIDPSGKITAVKADTEGATIELDPAGYTGEKENLPTIIVHVYQPLDIKDTVKIKVPDNGLADITKIKSETAADGKTTITSDGIPKGPVILSLDGVGGAPPTETLTWGIKTGKYEDGTPIETGIAEINSTTGLLTIKKIGKTVITVKGKDSGLIKDIELIVGSVPLTGVTIGLPNDDTTTATTPLQLGKGFSIDLEADLIPAEATNVKVSWKSSNNSDVSVNATTGVAKGLKIGKTATITVTAEGDTADGKRVTVTDTMAIKVVEPGEIPDVDIYTMTDAGLKDQLLTTTEDNPLELDSGQQTKLLAIVTPPADKYTTSPNIFWKLSQTGVANFSVAVNTEKVTNADGKEETKVIENEFILTLTGSTTTTKAGEVIRAVASNVVDFPSIYLRLKPIPPTGITITNVPKIVEIGKSSKALKVALTPKNGHKTVEWSVDDETTALIDKTTGVMTGLKAGKVVVTATSTIAPTIMDSVEVEVGTPLKTAKLNATSVILAPGEDFQLVVGLTPYVLNDPLLKEVTYVSREPYIATVGYTSGLISIPPNALQKEYTTIDVYIGQDEKKLSCKVTINDAGGPVLTGVTATTTKHKMNLGATKKLPYKMTPSKATPSGVIWASLDPNVAYVDQLGNVTAVGASDTGETQVTARFPTFPTGGTQVETILTYDIQINPTLVLSKDASGIFDKRVQVTLKEGETVTITADVRPAPTQNITWKTTSKYLGLSAITGDSIIITAKDLSGRSSGSGSVTVRDSISGKSATVSIKVLPKTTP